MIQRLLPPHVAQPPDTTHSSWQSDEGWTHMLYWDSDGAWQGLQPISCWATCTMRNRVGKGDASPVGPQPSWLSTSHLSTNATWVCLLYLLQDIAVLICVSVSVFLPFSYVTCVVTLTSSEVASHVNFIPLFHNPASKCRGGLVCQTWGLIRFNA